MSNSSPQPENRVRTVLHPTDLSDTSELAFAHALRVATSDHAKLSILHVSHDEKHTPWHKFPSVRPLLERWGLLDEGARRSDVYEQLGVEVEKVAGHDRSVVDSIVAFVDDKPVDLVVIATRGHEGMPRWLSPSISEPVARRTNVPTLFVPQGARGCVSLEDGGVTMKEVLIPIDHQPNPQPGIDQAIPTLDLFGDEGSQLTLLHVGEEDRMPDVTLPTDKPWRSRRVVRGGNPVEEILREADELTANLLVMVTAGRQGFLDALRGTTTEQVVRRAPCPVLVVPFRR